MTHDMHSDQPRWMTSPVLRVDHLTLRFGGLVAVNDLSFSAGAGDITALIGPNGAGKTTVFNCITGFYKPTAGRLVVFHSPQDIADEVAGITRGSEPYALKASAFLIERMPDYTVSAAAKVARTFQNIRLFTGMTVLENLLIAQHNKLMQASGFSMLGMVFAPSFVRAERQAVDRAIFWLDRIGLLDRADDAAGELPYGDQRRLEIARAMCTEPILLCLDEPAAGLNPRESLELNELLYEIRDEHGTSILLIEHDMSVVMEVSNHIVVLEYGKKIADGTPEQIRDDPAVLAAYLGVDEDEVEAVEREVGL